MLPFARTEVDMSRIRAASPADIPALVGLMSAFYAEAGLPLPRTPAERAFATLLAEPRLGGVWLAEDDDTARGYVVLTLGFSMEYGGTRGFIDDLFVDPAARGRGVAAALLDRVRSASAERGVRVLHVEVGPENLRARQLYHRAGYAENGHLQLTIPLAAPLHAP
jgi:ribosomal protein S18 acetylase RimI-like enzyme